MEPKQLSPKRILIIVNSDLGAQYKAFLSSTDYSLRLFTFDDQVSIQRFEMGGWKTMRHNGLRASIEEIVQVVLFRHLTLQNRRLLPCPYCPEDNLDARQTRPR
jgi:hypothetical protein